MLVRDADWPTLVRSNDGDQHLFWRKATDGRLYYGMVENETLTGTQQIDSAIDLQAGDRLHNLMAALDQSYLYLFWNLTRLTGESQSWMLSGALETLDWREPVRLGVEIGEGTIETGFNSGRVTSTSSGSTYLRQVTPLPGQFDTLPVAAHLDDSLAMVYFRGGQIVGLQRIAPVELLLGPPGLQTDRERHLYLTWSEPTEDGTAALKLTTTRR
jgi:hypothetical protein